MIGLATAAAYPFIGHDSGSCASKPSAAGSRISGWQQVSGSVDGTGPVNVSNVQAVVATMGPVAVGIDANTQLMQFYHGGFYAGNCTFTSGYRICMGDCGQKITDLNHAALIVGFGAESPGTDSCVAGYGLSHCPYWIVKNSWGPG